MFEARKVLKLLGTGVVVCLIVLLARALITTSESRRYYNRLFSSFQAKQLQAGAVNSTVAFNYSAAAVAPKKATESSAPLFKLASNMSYPKLYSALKPIARPVSFAAAATIGSKACQRPQSQNMVSHLFKDRTVVEAEGAAPGTVEGGFFAPKSCWPPLSYTAVIVPYRNRSENLDIFVPYIHRLLSKQNILFGLFIVEQADLRLFNRAKLLNIGFQISQQFYKFDCFVFHDSDKVPENVANVYDCANSPKLLISEMRSQDSSKYNKGMIYHNFFGGVSAVPKDAFLKANGNSNRYYGWGREDDELASRLSISGYSLRYSRGPDARYINLRHGNDIVTNTMPWPYSHKVRQTMSTDGLNSLSYSNLKLFLHPLFVLIRAEV